jgi:hypothetical protein
MLFYTYPYSSSVPALFDTDQIIIIETEDFSAFPSLQTLNIAVQVTIPDATGSLLPVCGKPCLKKGNEC